MGISGGLFIAIIIAYFMMQKMLNKTDIKRIKKLRKRKLKKLKKDKNLYGKKY